MSKGIVRFFNVQKGYGFIDEESGKEVFVHFTELAAAGLPDLPKGQAVEFDMEQDERGPRPRAVHLKLPKP